jgi:hypothetical protein
MVVSLAAMDIEVSSYELFYPWYFTDKSSMLILLVYPTEKQIKLTDRINISLSGTIEYSHRCCWANVETALNRFDFLPSVYKFYVVRKILILTGRHSKALHNAENVIQIAFLNALWTVHLA